MFILNTFSMVTLIALLSFVSGANQSLEATAVEKNIVDANPAETAVLTQLKISESNGGDALYNYKCTVGTQTTNNLACTGRDSTFWSSPQNVELKFRCPKFGYDRPIAFVEIIYSVTSDNVNCFVHEGGIGSGSIGVTVIALNTLELNYLANFYTY